MKRISICLTALLWGLLANASTLAADPAESLKRFSSFQKIDLERLMSGEILGQRGQLMKFPNGISSQICYAVPTSPEETVRRLQTWDPTRCASLNIYASCGLNNPCDVKDFKAFHLDPGHRPIKWLLEKTLTTTPDKSDLNLARAEAVELAECLRKDSSSDRASSCWAKLLFSRATAFQSMGLAGVLPYETGGERISPVTQIRTMLQEEERIIQEFTPILKRSGIIHDGSGIPPLRPSYRWSLFEADHHATINLGAVYQVAIGDRYQLLDMDYYVSGNYYAAVTLYGIWPIRHGGKTGSLVWRGDFFAAPMLRFTKGIERIAYGAVMIQEIKKEIRCFQDEIRIKR